jgi:hypothetical protein
MRLQKAGRCSELVYPCLHIEIDNDDEFAMLESEILSTLIATIYDAAPDPDLWIPLHWKAFATSSADVPRISIAGRARTHRTLLSESTVRTHLKRLFEKPERTGKLTSSSSSLHPQFGFLICMIAH